MDLTLPNSPKRYKKEIASLKRIIGKYAVANDALKKAPEGGLE